MEQYDELIVTTPRPPEMTHFRLPPDMRRSLLWMDSSLVDGACNIECAWYYKPFEGPGHHVHNDTDEILGYFGTDPNDPSSLGGVIEFRIGDEIKTLTKSCLIYLPKGLPHCPYRVLSVDHPIFHIAVTPGRKFAKSPDKAPGQEVK